MANWVDLLDPSQDEVREALPEGVRESVVAVVGTSAHTDEPRATLQGHGHYIFGVFVIPVAVPEEDRVYYQEIDVVATHETLLTIRKTPPGEKPFEPPAERHDLIRKSPSTGMMLYRIVDAIAERFLDLVDDLDGEIDELEDAVETSTPASTRARISELRHDLLHIRRTLTPTRDAIRRVVDDVVDVTEGPEVFTHEAEVAFNLAYDKLLRAFDGLELSRDLLASVRDYLQAKVANDQNEVMKRLTVIASLLLVPTFIVGLYGQNFQHHFPELHWQYGYAFSWALIIGTTIAQLLFFRWKRWL